MRKIIAAALCICFYYGGSGNELAAQSGTENMPVDLYGGLTRGLKPEEAAIKVLQLDGVKSAKLKKQTKPVAVMCVDISHDMLRGGDYGGQTGFLFIECDSQGVKAVTIKFSAAKNAFREMVPMCLSDAGNSFKRLEQLLSSKYEEIGRSKLEFDNYYIQSARLMAAREKLSVEVGSKPIGSLNIGSPSVVFTDGNRAIVLQSKTNNWVFYKTMPNLSQAMCSEDQGWQAQPEIRYMSLAEWRTEQETPSRQIKNNL